MSARKRRRNRGTRTVSMRGYNFAKEQVGFLLVITVSLISRFIRNCLIGEWEEGVDEAVGDQSSAEDGDRTEF